MVHSMLKLVPEVSITAASPKPAVRPLATRRTYTPRASAVLLATSPAPATLPWRKMRALGGALVGAFVPCAVFALVHFTAWQSWRLAPLVAGGLLFSAKTVYQWTSRCFRDRGKGLGWTVLAEGIMTLSPPILLPLALIALGFLATINALESARIASTPASTPADMS